MNEGWNKEGSIQSSIDRRKLDDIHLAVCGNDELGVPGLVQDMASVKARLTPLEKAKDGTITVGMAMRFLGMVIIGLLGGASSIVLIIEFIIKKP